MGAIKCWGKVAEEGLIFVKGKLPKNIQESDIAPKARFFFYYFRPKNTSIMSTWGEGRSYLGPHIIGPGGGHSFLPSPPPCMRLRWSRTKTSQCIHAFWVEVNYICVSNWCFIRVKRMEIPYHISLRGTKDVPQTSWIVECVQSL